MSLSVIQTRQQPILSTYPGHGTGLFLVFANGWVEFNWMTAFSATDWTRASLVFDVGLTTQPSALSVSAFPQTLDVVVDTGNTSGFGWSVDDAAANWNASSRTVEVTTQLAIKSRCSELLRIGYQVIASYIVAS